MYKCKLYRRSGLLCAVVLLVKEKEGKKKKDEVKGLWPKRESRIHCQKPLVGASQEVT